MRAIVQRVSRASVRVEGEIGGTCGHGLLVLIAAHRHDSDAVPAKLADRIAKLRIFNDAEGKMNLAIRDLDPPGSILAISNFTLYGETAKNRRPSFIDSAPYDRGNELYELFLSSLRTTGIPVSAGVFGAHMEVELVNDGPVTVIVDVEA